MTLKYNRKQNKINLKGIQFEFFGLPKSWKLEKT